MTPAALAGGTAVALATLAVAQVVVALRRARSGRLRRPRRRGRAVVVLLTRAGRRIGVAPAPDALAARLAAAGSPAGLAPADVMAAKTALGLLALLAALGPAAALPGRLGPVALVVLPLAAAASPELWLRRRAHARGCAMAAEVADVLDLLRVCVEAGRPPNAALAEVGRRHRGVLGAELRRAADELALGRARAPVLADLTARCPLGEVAALAAAIGRADRHGAPLGTALVAIAADARAARARAVREQAAKAAPKIQVVVALLLVPAVMLLVAAALTAAFDVT